MQAHTIADITPNGAAVPIGAAGVKAVWIVFVATGNTIRVGDSNVGAARGVKVPSGSEIYLVRGDFNQGGYDLGQVYVYGAAGSDSVSITYGS